MTIKHENNEVRHMKKTINKIKRPFKKKDNKPRISRVLQQLFVSCREVFKGPGTVPPASDVHKLCSILDKMKAEDVGLKRNLTSFKARSVVVKGTPRVTYTTIYHCEEFSLCIFFLPATAVIPLHNHPGMTVFNKLLLGKMHIKSYDLVDSNSEDSIPPSQLRLARLVANSVFTAPCDTSVLYPASGGNIHQFTAITPCAVLDVLGPPYSKAEGRDCSYYKDIPYRDFSNGETIVSEEENDQFACLEEIEGPENSQMDRIEYSGPQIRATSC